MLTDVTNEHKQTWHILPGFFVACCFKHKLLQTLLVVIHTTQEGQFTVSISAPFRTVLNFSMHAHEESFFHNNHSIMRGFFSHGALTT